MKLFQNSLLKINHILTLAILIGLLNSCGAWDPGKWSEHKARKIDPSGDVRARKSVEEGRAMSGNKMFGGRGGDFQFASANVMWRATLEVLDFLPLANVDYGGGLVITDWYNEGTAPNESIKITVRFLSNEIRADGLKVLVHKKVCNAAQGCRIKKISSSLEEEVKLAILKKATILHSQRKDGAVAAYRKKHGNLPKRISERGGQTD